MSGTICARINHEWSQLKTFYNCWISAYLYSRGGGMHYTESEMFGLYGLDIAWTYFLTSRDGSSRPSQLWDVKWKKRFCVTM